MTTFLVSTVPNPALETVLSSIGARPLAPGSWIAPWEGSAHALCKRLRSASAIPLVVCALSADWYYE